MQHFVLTRFNVPFVDRWQEVSRQPGWMTERLDLFERFCLPSMMGQSHRDFQWLIYLDDQTSNANKERMINLTADAANIELIWTSAEKMDHLADIRNRLKAETRFVLSTRLDNDDAVHQNFVSDLVAGARNHDNHPVVFNFPVGLSCRGKRLYSAYDESNAFTSLLSSSDDLVTIWTTRHRELSRIAPVVQLGIQPRWLQVIHGRNLSNRIKGPRVARSRLAGFRIEGMAYTSESTWQIVVENICCYWFIWLREGLVAQMNKLGFL